MIATTITPATANAKITIMVIMTGVVISETPTLYPLRFAPNPLQSGSVIYIDDGDVDH